MDTLCAFNFTSSLIDESEILCCYRLPIGHRQGVIGIIVAVRQGAEKMRDLSRN
jgi:hypothetical protein